MNKLVLNLDKLEVQTFETLSETADRGTVFGHGTRVTRCYSECNVCTYTHCQTDERTEIDCMC